MYDKLREREKEKRQRQRQREIVRSSHWRCSVKRFLKILQNPQEKHLCQSLFFNKVAGLRSATLLKKKLWYRCFPVKFAKFLRTPFVQNTSGRLSYKERRYHTKFLEGCCWGAGFYWRRFMIFFTFTFAKEAKEVAINS